MIIYNNWGLNMDLNAHIIILRICMHFWKTYQQENE